MFNKLVPTEIYDGKSKNTCTNSQVDKLLFYVLQCTVTIICVSFLFLMQDSETEM